jgi:hypothetical protein
MHESWHVLFGRTGEFLKTQEKVVDKCLVGGGEMI